MTSRPSVSAGRSRRGAGTWRCGREVVARHLRRGRFKDLQHGRRMSSSASRFGNKTASAPWPLTPVAPSCWLRPPPMAPRFDDGWILSADGGNCDTAGLVVRVVRRPEARGTIYVPMLMRHLATPGLLVVSMTPESRHVALACTQPSRARESTPPSRARDQQIGRAHV